MSFKVRQHTYIPTLPFVYLSQAKTKKLSPKFETWDFSIHGHMFQLSIKSFLETVADHLEEMHYYWAGAKALKQQINENCSGPYSKWCH